MKTNTRLSYASTTHEGGAADPHQKPITELERAVATCLLWEDTFYEKGSDLAARIATLCQEVSAEALAALAVKARTEWKLRHVPLWLVRQMVRLHKGRVVGDAIAAVVQRPDEAAELVSLYWRDGRKMLPKQMKRGLGLAFRRWDEYRLAKWDRAKAIKLRDVLFLARPKPKDAEQDALWKRLIAGTLATPDTWENALSSGADPRETWERLLRERTLGYMALLQNLRNMEQAGGDRALIDGALLAGAEKSWALHFRFIMSAKHAPPFAQALSDAMVASVSGLERLPGSTHFVVDVSGSMEYALSAPEVQATAYYQARVHGTDPTTKSRLDAAGALAVLLREVCATARVFTFSNRLVEVANLRGLALCSAIVTSQEHGATHLKAALDTLRAKIPTADRVLVITDEQSQDGIAAAWAPRSYLLNVAPYKPGLDVHHGWVRINGWSERVVDWLRWHETADAR